MGQKSEAAAIDYSSCNGCYSVVVITRDFDDEHVPETQVRALVAP
jgi:hypothetical protein